MPWFYKKCWIFTGGVFNTPLMPDSSVYAFDLGNNNELNTLKKMHQQFNWNTKQDASKCSLKMTIFGILYFKEGSNKMIKWTQVT